jgi:hypothetical protein
MNELIRKHSKLGDYIRAFNSLPDIDKRYEFEDIGGLFLKQHPLYGPTVYSSNTKEVPEKKQKEWNIVGLRGKGADWWCDSKVFGGAVAAEVKYQHDETKSLKMKKFGDKDKFLQKANVVEKVMITNVTSVSRFVEEYADDWTYIFGDDIFRPDVYKRMRDIALAEEHNQKAVVLKPDTPISYRISEMGFDEGSDLFHKNSIEIDAHNDIVSQIKKFCNARTIWQKPTASGKGFDCILYWKNCFKPYLLLQNKKKKTFITCTVSPSLAILSGNVEKQRYDIDARGDIVSLYILASAGDGDTGGKQEINSLKTKAKILKQMELYEKIEKAIKTGGHIHIETTIHSYWKLAEILISLKITGDFMYIDEVKNTVLDESSKIDHKYTQCLFDKYAKWLVRVGADANEREVTDSEGEQISTSMKNTELWRSKSINWEEDEVTSRGWKRRARPEVGIYDVNYLPPNIASLILNKKNGVIIKDTDAGGMKVNLEWRLDLEFMALRLLECDRKYPFYKVRTIERSKGFEKYATKVWPAIVKQHGDARSPEIKRLLKFSFLGIYREGNSHNKILSFVESIPDNYPDGAVIIQVKKLCEGWDPVDGWIDAVGFADTSTSPSLISQFIGRGARLDKKRKFMDLPIWFTQIIDSNDDVSIPHFMKVVDSVTTDLSDGKNINESIKMHDYTNAGNPSSTNSRGSKTYKGVIAQGGFLNAFVNTKRFGRFSPFVSVVEEIYHTNKDIWYSTEYNNVGRQKIIKEVITNKKFKEFFQQFKNYSNKRHMMSKIMKGTYFLLPFELKKNALTNCKKAKEFYRKDVRRQAYNWLITTKDIVEQEQENLKDYVGLKHEGIVMQLIVKIRENSEVDVNRQISYWGTKGNGSLIKSYPNSGKLLVTLFRNSITEFINKVEEFTNEMCNDYMELQKKTVTNSYTGPTVGKLKKMVMEKYNYTSRTARTLDNIKSSLTREQLEITTKKNIKLAMSIYKNIHYNETLSDKFANVTERNTRFIEECENQGLIVANLVANPVHTAINPNISKEFRKEHDVYWNKHTAQLGISARNEYINGVSKSFIMHDKEYPSRMHAARKLGVGMKCMMKLENHRPDLYYFKDKGPSTPKECTFHITPNNYSTVRTYLMPNDYSHGPSWWNEKSAKYPKEYYTEIRLPTEQEIIDGRVGLNKSRKIKSLKEVA